MKITANGETQTVSNVEEIVDVLQELTKAKVSYDGPSRTVSIDAMQATRDGAYGRLKAQIVIETEEDLSEVEGALEDSCSAMVCFDGDIDGGEFEIEL